ncbi:uncharacterized protein LOC135675245 [Musa acuminata AAA Group]|uniref:uncharacterized protein LOC135675245 n=1 Tax=Musa acuminata AAA Group TaxID=214697 RepID=UPI0031CE65BB
MPLAGFDIAIRLAWRTILSQGMGGLGRRLLRLGERAGANPDEVSRVYYADGRIHIRKNRIGLCFDEGCRLQATDMDHLHRLHPPLASFAASWSLPWQPQEADGVATAEELKQALLRTTLELESTRATAKEELRRMESRGLHLSRLLEAATRERDEARHALLLLLLHHTDRGQPLQEPKPILGPNLALDEGTDVAEAAAAAAAATAAAEDVVERSNRASSAVAEVELAAVRRALPEKGRLVEAGPLLLLSPVHIWPWTIWPIESKSANERNKKEEREAIGGAVAIVVPPAAGPAQLRDPACGHQSELDTEEGEGRGRVSVAVLLLEFLIILFPRKWQSP